MYRIVDLAAERGWGIEYHDGGEKYARISPPANLASEAFNSFLGEFEEQGIADVRITLVGPSGRVVSNS